MKGNNNHNGNNNTENNSMSNNNMNNNDNSRSNNDSNRSSNNNDNNRRFGSSEGGNRRFGSSNGGNRRFGSSSSSSNGGNRRFGSNSGSSEGGNRRFGSSNSSEGGRRFGSSNGGNRRFGSSSNDGGNRRFGNNDNRTNNSSDTQNSYENKGNNQFRDNERHNRVLNMKDNIFRQSRNMTRNNELEISIQLSNDKCMPCRKTSGSVGYDLYVNVIESIEIPSLTPYIVPTGVFIDLKEKDNIYAQICGRSSSLLKGYFIQTGVIDIDYRGEIGVVVFNLNTTSIVLKAGERIAQLCFMRFLSPVLKIKEQLSDTERGSDGFGSTGK